MTTRTIFWLGCAFPLAGALGCGSASKASASGAQASGDAGSDANLNTSGTGACGPNAIKAGTFDFTYQKIKYSYIVHLPPSYDGTKRTPLVLNWHGFTSTAQEQEVFSAMDPVSDSEGFVLVYPNSPDKSWNAGTCCSTAGRDDVGFAVALVAQLQSQACIDAKRIYTTGMSNGAFMSYRLGCEHAELFAAIAPVAGKVGIPTCTPSRPVPVMAFHGTADTLVAYDTGALSGENLSVPDTVKAWATRDGCSLTSAVTYQMGTVTCDTYSACSAGATVTLCTATGEGHCWPGQSACPFGNGTIDIDASKEIAAFFKKFSLP